MGNQIGSLHILPIKLLPQFLSSAHEIWHAHWSWDEDEQDIFSSSVRICFAMIWHIVAVDLEMCIELLPHFQAMLRKLSTHIGWRY